MIIKKTFTEKTLRKVIDDTVRDLFNSGNWKSMEFVAGPARDSLKATISPHDESFLRKIDLGFLPSLFYLDPSKALPNECGAIGNCRLIIDKDQEPGTISFHV